MAIFGSPTAYAGVDVGTASLKIVELVARSRRIEVGTYAQARVSGVLTRLDIDDDTAVKSTSEVISEMIDESGVSTDHIIAALPNSIVFSTVVKLPNLEEKEMEKAVQFTARDVVPADINEMVLGWSKMDLPAGQAGSQEEIEEGPVPVFLTAAPKQLVNRYLAVASTIGAQLVALEVETIPLVRALMVSAPKTGLIVDIGDRVTTYHIIDSGTPRLSHTIDHGGADITAAISKELSISVEEAETQKVKFGLSGEAPQPQQVATRQMVDAQISKAQSLVDMYRQKEGKDITHTILIGGGANMLGLQEYWTQTSGSMARIGNPWRGLSYPQQLEETLTALAPTFGVAVGLALRGFS